MALKIFWTKRALNNFNNILDYLQSDLGETPTKTLPLKSIVLWTTFKIFLSLVQFKTLRNKSEDL